MYAVQCVHNQNLTFETYHKLTYPGLLLNFKSFTSFSYKISLIKCLIDKSFKICSNWKSFHNDLGNIKSNLIKKAYPSFIFHKVIKMYLGHKLYSNKNELKNTSYVYYFKLPYTSNLLHRSENKTSNFSSKDALSIRKTAIPSAINKRSEEL